MQVPYHSTDMCVDLAACMVTGRLMLISYKYFLSLPYAGGSDLPGVGIYKQSRMISCVSLRLLTSSCKKVPD